jgi:CheY-like chemotaxis protein
MKKQLLLLIEDNALLTGLYQSAFEKAGFSVVIAHDGKSGLALANEVKPDGIILDLLMPGTDGFQVLAALKQDPQAEHIKTIVLTTVVKNDALERARSLGALECLVKSELRLDEIIARVQKHF